MAARELINWLIGAASAIIGVATFLVPNVSPVLVVLLLFVAAAAFIPVKVPADELKFVVTFDILRYVAFSLIVVVAAQQLAKSTIREGVPQEVRRAMFDMRDESRADRLDVDMTTIEDDHALQPHASYVVQATGQARNTGKVTAFGFPLKRVMEKTSKRVWSEVERFLLLLAVICVVASVLLRLVVYIATRLPKPESVLSH